MVKQNFFLFDIDDNVMFMPTGLHVYYSMLKHNHIDITSQEFAKHSEFIDKLDLYETRGDSYENMSDDPNITDPAQQTFLKDLRRMLKSGDAQWKGPCWDILELAVDCQFPVAFVTARSHAPETIKAGVSYLVEKGQLSREPNYLGVYPVNNPEVRASLVEASGGTVSEGDTPGLKRVAIGQLLDKGKDLYGEDEPHTMWMSDDDQKNVKDILKCFYDLKYHNLHMGFYVVNSGCASAIDSMILSEISGPSSAKHSVIHGVHCILETLGICNQYIPPPPAGEYACKDYAEDEHISCLTVAGTHCAWLSFNATDAGRKDFVGFAVQKLDVGAGTTWPLGWTVHEDVTVDGVNLRGTRMIQGFQWGDYTLLPGNKYTYTITPLYTTDTEGQLRYGGSLHCNVQTMGQRMDGSQDDVVCFNRACAQSQAYLDKFGHTEVNDMEEPMRSEACAWLSRGLGEKMTEFIDLAKNKRFGIRAALYEFSYKEACYAFQRAIKNTGNCRMIVHKRDVNKSPWTETKETIATYFNGESGTYEDGYPIIERNGTPKSAIFHNKFVILLEDDEPVAVWTGGCNMTESGVCGQANVGHAVFRKDVAASFLEYWMRIKDDPDSRPTKDGNDKQTPTDLKLTPTDPLFKYQPFFSPRDDKGLLDKYVAKDTLGGESYGDSCLGDLLMNARPGAPVFISLPFGIGDQIMKYLRPHTDRNKYLLMNTRAQGGSQSQWDNWDEILKDDRAYVAVGAKLEEETASGLSGHVLYIHNKTMIIDPFGPEPVVVTGSANFSESSMIKNDENIVVIRNNPEVTHVYITEFMRLWTHYAGRNNLYGDKPEHRPEMKMNSDWVEKFYDGKSRDHFQREAFGIEWNNKAKCDASAAPVTE